MDKHGSYFESATRIKYYSYKTVSFQDYSCTHRTSEHLPPSKVLLKLAVCLSSADGRRIILELTLLSAASVAAAVAPTDNTKDTGHAQR